MSSASWKVRFSLSNIHQHHDLWHEQGYIIPLTKMFIQHLIASSYPSTKLYVKHALPTMFPYMCPDVLQFLDQTLLTCVAQPTELVRIATLEFSIYWQRAGLERMGLNTDAKDEDDARKHHSGILERIKQTYKGNAIIIHR